MLPKKKFSHSVLENELFISAFSSEQRVCVIITAGYRTSIRFEFRSRCVQSIETTQEVWTSVMTWTRARLKSQI